MEVENDPNIVYKGDLEESLDYATFGDLLVKSLKAGGDKICLIDGVTEQQFTYNDILRETIKAAKALYGAGIRQNDVVAILSENRIEYAALSYGTLFLNATIAPTNISYTERELKHTLGITRPKYVIISKEAKGDLEVVKSLSYVQRIILLDDDIADDGRQISYSNFVNKFGNNEFDVEKFVKEPVKLFDQVGVIFMSSGTTGLPKGVELSQGNLIACAVLNFEKVRLGLQLFEKLVSLSVAPWFHAMGFMGKLLITASSEVTLVYLNKFEPKRYLSCIEKYKIVSLHIPPPIIIFLAKTPLFSKYDLSSLKLIVCGAAPLSKETEDQVRERFNNEIFVMQAYGQTEATLGVLFCEVATAKPGSVGEIVKGTYGKVIDANGKSLGPNQVGELCFKGPLTMRGYRNNPKETESTVDKDGWLHSGDLGYYDEDKQFFIVDRLKELIKYKGYQVPPAELEGILLSHPKIKDAGVIGIPDEIAGELPFAFVVKEGDLTEQEVKDYVAKTVSNPKWLRGGVKFIEEIPKNPSGKIIRREMKELYKSMKAKL
ncbi:luciferin 4-monooxygenase-like [Chironomus tepperi]|uniref:luciferin 4-monooxygenase-like n=1 Tax=Chironomus tepperi TaxID=113505 RepID=UPI00391F5E59